MKINLTGDGKKKNAGLLRLVKTHFLAQKPRFFRLFLIKSSLKSVDSQTIKQKYEILGTLIMHKPNEPRSYHGLDERRTEQRLCYSSPVWFGEHPKETLAQGQMVDISSRGAAFITYAHDSYPSFGQHIIARFRVPNYRPDHSFDLVNFTRSAHVCRVDRVYSYWRRVAVQFAEPLPFKPGEK